MDCVEYFLSAFDDICAAEFPGHIAALAAYREMGLAAIGNGDTRKFGKALQAFFAEHQPAWPRYERWFEARGPRIGPDDLDDEDDPEGQYRSMKWARAGELLALRFLFLAYGRARLVRFTRNAANRPYWRLNADPECPGCREEPGLPTHWDSPYWKGRLPLCDWLGCKNMLQAVGEDQLGRSRTYSVAEVLYRHEKDLGFSLLEQQPKEIKLLIQALKDLSLGESDAALEKLGGAVSLSQNHEIAEKYFSLKFETLGGNSFTEELDRLASHGRVGSHVHSGLLMQRVKALYALGRKLDARSLMVRANELLLAEGERTAYPRDKEWVLAKVLQLKKSARRYRLNL